ncbi:hypothetical protein TNIN_116671 [Trichonephila inaurata madagascariensis]|uniref:Uncharacterized protein n=1 Tax=Trichonephila inaurata madagascariensis TaxID=2747483 RepID=A0A8X6IIS7_9ARAC|nr:hypothetical protein TNIN_116671 [Trichonephila inaurata madagascariensis]
MGKTLHAFHLRGRILDAWSVPEHNTIFECNFHDPLYKELYFPFHLKKDELITAIYSSFVNNGLTLRCECAFSTGIAFSGIESIVYGCNTSSMNSAVSDPLSNIVARNLKSVLREQLFCDTKLKTKPAVSAHKCVFSVHVLPCLESLVHTGRSGGVCERGISWTTTLSNGCCNMCTWESLEV